ncbi:clathrin light chain isoform X1 [Leptopilina heterotoma]|uniref:clathrin light chain isoform X1 n=1 Tax=Leptopilina heterotoma TaxID=63436 RepID=UPI001CA802A1|nr:clathrin light chain isoform X1 [Leptopilina heterotoma]
MDAFGDNFVEPAEVDPAAEFLAREQNELAGLEVEIPPMTNVAPISIDDEPELDLEPEPEPEVPAPPPPVKEEPEKIKKWREEQKARLEEKDAEEEKKKQEWKEVAKKELEEWYKHHVETISKTKATNRESAKNAEKQFVAEADEVEPGTEWERIAKLCDFNPKSARTSKDVSRMRSIILQLKQNPPSAINC